MKMSRHSVLARLAAVGTVGAAALLGAAPAGAEISPTIISPNEQLTDYPGHCAKVEIVYARGTAEPANQSWALNGFNYSLPDWWGSSRNSPYSIWFQITKDLGNRMVDPPGAAPPEPEYVMEYSKTDPAVPLKSRGRSDFYLYNLDYPATLDFLGTQPSQNYSVQKGTRTLINHLNDEAARCPNKKFLLFGYSQGSLIVANAISKPSKMKYIYENSSNPMPILYYYAMDQIVSVGMLADAGFNSTEQFAVWNPATQSSRLEYNKAKYSGSPILPNASWALDEGSPSETNGRRNMANGPLTGTVRGQLEAPPVGPQVGLRDGYWHWTPFEDRIRNYCVLADPICNRSATDAGEHLNYFDNGFPRRDLAMFAVRWLRADDPRWAGQTQAQMHATYWNPDDSLIVP